MSKLIDGVEHYTAKEITELCGVTSSAFNNTVYRHGLSRVMHDKHWYYPQSSVDVYQSLCKTKHTAPLQSQSAPTEQPSAALHSLDPLSEEPGPAEEEPASLDTIIAEKLATFPELTPEDLMLRRIMANLRHQASEEQQWRARKFIDTLKAIRTSLDLLIAEYEAGDDDTSSQ